ncbi:MAG: FAD-binding protein [Muribaculaceae bacterium]|nr:FAD-binding protein [Muribaculaceae bacterium]
MLKELTLRVAPETAYEPQKLNERVAKELHVDRNRIKRVDIMKRSIDARQRQVVINLSLRVHLDNIDEQVTDFLPIQYQNVKDKPQVIIVGAGPAGLFSALQLIERGYRPIVLERGKDVDSRRKDMALISREQKVNPESNYCFGEGGAGAYSDGKLYTRSKKRGSVDKVLQIFVQHGAQREILVDAHPHIGTDRLPNVIKAIRETIIAAGGEVHFETRVTELIVKDNKIIGAVTADGHRFDGPVILATGHSARDVYEMLNRIGATMSPKGIAVGVRLEHPQKTIDRIQYHSPQGRGKYLPAAEYSMLTRVDDRAVYSFCMCPGGFIIPAASGEGQLVVNGMSPSNRGTQWANSGMVVEILPEDLPEYDKFGQLKMLKFQEDVEKHFYEAAEQTQRAPAQRMTDFVKGKLSDSLPRSSYAPGVFSARLDQLLPDFIARRLQKGFEEFGRKSRGFLCDEAILVGDETRTSAPVQISRDRESLRHVDFEGLYPCGEGAGYAGGIVSAAIDGMRCADAAVNALENA